MFRSLVIAPLQSRFAAMDTMSRSPALNPASTPFFPGGGLVKEEDRVSDMAFRMPTTREQYSSNTSSLSISPSDYRSVKSSPSPEHEDQEGPLDNFTQHQSYNDAFRQSPAISQVEAERGFPPMFRHSMKESSMSAVLETIPDVEGGNGVHGSVNGNGSLLSSTLYTTVMGRRDRLNTPPVMADYNGKPGSFTNGPRLSISPSSSLDSTTMFPSGMEMSGALSFDDQLRASPLFANMLERVARSESLAREIQRDLVDIHAKVNNLALEKSISSNSPPEFRDPFAPSATAQSFSGPGLNGPRGSIIGNIPPNQSADDFTTISHRLHTLTNSVDQLLAISTQSQPANPAMVTTSMLGPNQPRDMLASQMMAPPLGSMNGLGHGVPNRGDLRTNSRGPNAPMRTWSAGNLDIPPRGSESGPSGLGRPDNMFRDKRRSVSGLLRRDSAGVSIRSVIIMNSANR